MYEDNEQNILAEIVNYDEENMAIKIPREVIQSSGVLGNTLSLTIETNAASIHSIETLAIVFMSNEVIRTSSAAKELVRLVNNGGWKPEYTLEVVTKLMATDIDELDPILIPLRSICDLFLKDIIPHDRALLPFYLNTYIDNKKQRHALGLPE